MKLTLLDAGNPKATPPTEPTPFASVTLMDDGGMALAAADADTMLRAAIILDTARRAVKSRAVPEPTNQALLTWLANDSPLAQKQLVTMETP